MPGSAVVGVLRVLLTGESAQYEATLKRSADTAKAWSRDMNQVGLQAQKIGSALTVGITLPLVGLAAASVKAAMSFESSFANVGKTVDGVSDKFGKLTPKGLELANSMRQMAKEIPATTDELNAIAAMGGQMGVPIEQLSKFTRNVAALGVAVDGISPEEAAKALAQIANVFGDKEVRNIDKMSSALVHLGNNSNATEADILEFTKRLSGAGRSVGMTIPEIMALGTAMADVGLNAEAGGTAMSVVIAKISKAVSTGGESLTEFAKVANKSADEFAAVWKRSPIEAMDLFVKGLSTMRTRGVDLNLTMGELGTEGIRVAATLKQLAGAGDGISRSLVTANEGWATGNKHLEEAEKKYATTANQLKLLWNQIRDVGITLGNAFLPGIKSMVSVMSGLIPVIDKVAAVFSMLPGPVQALIVGVAGVVAAIGPAIYLFGTLARSASDVAAAFGKKGIATRLLAGDLVFLEGGAGKAAGALSLLGKAAAVAAAGFVGWQIGRLIADLAGLDEKIANSITHLDELNKARGQTAGGGQSGRAAVVSDLTQKEKDLRDAIQDGNKALAARLQSEIEAVKNDQTRLAILDTLNRAIALGADKNITYANAVTFLAQKEQERLAALKATADEQQRTGKSTEALAAVTSGFREKLAEADKQIAQLSKSARADLTEALKSGAFEMKVLTKESGLSEFAIKRFKDQMKDGAAAVKEKAKQDSAAEKAAKAHAAMLEKQAAALEKLGVVTENHVLKALAEFDTQIRLATAAGVPLDKVLVALAPHLEDLRVKAKNSGIDLSKMGSLLNESTAAFQRMLDAISAGGPRATQGLSVIPGTVLKINGALQVARISAQNTADSFHFFGLQTRAELEATARAAVAHYEEIKRSGVATPLQIKKAFDEMQEALHAAAGTVARDWGKTFSDVSRLLGSLGGAFDGTFGSILKGAADVVQGIGAIASATTNLGKISAAVDLGATIGKKLQPLLGLNRGKLGALLGTNNQGRNDVEDWVKDNFGTFDELQKRLASIPNGQKLWQQVTQLPKNSDTKAAAAAMAAVTAAIEAQSKELARLATEGGTASKAMIAFRDANRDTAEVQGFIAGQTKKAADGFNGYLQAGAAALKGQSEAVKKLNELYARTGVEGAAAQGELAQAYREASEELKKQDALVAATAVTSQQAAGAMGAALAGTFGAFRAQGMSVGAALKEIQPGIVALRAQLEATGFTGGDAFDYINRLAGIAAGTISGPALDAIGMLSQGLYGAHNAGFLTQQMFEGLVGQIMVSRQAMIDQGATAEDVNALMQTDLQRIWQLQQDFGYKVDESTQLLLDEAQASGLVGDQHRSAMERAAIAMEKAAKAIIRAFGDIGDEADKVGGRIDNATRPRRVHVGFDVDDAPEAPEPGSPSPAPVSLGGLVTASGIRYLASGGLSSLGAAMSRFWKPRGTDTIPAMLTPKEGVVNTRGMDILGADGLSALNHGVDLLRMGAMGGSGGSDRLEVPSSGWGSGGGDTYNLHVHGNVDSWDRAKQVVNDFVAEVRRGGGAETRVRGALGMA